MRPADHPVPSQHVADAVEKIAGVCDMIDRAELAGAYRSGAYDTCPAVAMVADLLADNARLRAAAANSGA